MHAKHREDSNSHAKHEEDNIEDKKNTMNTMNAVIIFFFISSYMNECRYKCMESQNATHHPKCRRGSHHALWTAYGATNTQYKISKCRRGILPCSLDYTWEQTCHTNPKVQEGHFTILFGLYLGTNTPYKSQSIGGEFCYALWTILGNKHAEDTQKTRAPYNMPEDILYV